MLRESPKGPRPASGPAASAPAPFTMAPRGAMPTGGDEDDGSPRSGLDRLVRLIEYQVPAMRASVLLLDDDGRTLRHGAAPNLPAEYCRAIDGVQIGPRVGSCGTAAYRGEQVIVTDIATDPLWAEYRDLALPHGLRACWSTPIIDTSLAVLGTFAMYYAEPREPTTHELALTGTAAMLASNIIVRARMQAALRDRTEAAETAAHALAESEARMRAARTAAEQANRAKAEFLATMSHELRTPLNAIGGYASLMLDGVPTAVSDAHQDFLHRILQAQRHILGLIDAVLTHAQLEAGRVTYYTAVFDVADLLDLTDALVGPQLAAKRLRIDRTGCDPHLMLRADRDKVVQILANLLSNAVKFTPAGGLITIGAAPVTPDYARITVRDTGIGMTANEVAALFEPFTQFGPAPGPGEKGSGLGLAISRDLARGMGGDLTVTSEPAVGTEFVLTLPAGVYRPPAG